MFGRFSASARSSGRNADNQPPSPGQLKSIAWDQSFEAHSAIDYFLACGRRAQDLLVGYIGKVLRRQLPASMSDLVFCGLPSNPSEKAARSLVWEPAVDAYPYLRGELVALLSVVSHVVRVLLEHIPRPDNTRGSIVYSFRAPLYPDQTGGTIPLENDVDDLLKAPTI